MSRPVTAPRYRGASATYVQAWVCSGPSFDGLVYSQEIALDKLAEGCAINSVTIIRHDNGETEFEYGTLADRVFTHREGNAP